MHACCRADKRAKRKKKEFTHWYFEMSVLTRIRVCTCITYISSSGCSANIVICVCAGKTVVINLIVLLIFLV